MIMKNSRSIRLSCLHMKISVSLLKKSFYKWTLLGKKLVLLSVIICCLHYLLHIRFPLHRKAIIFLLPEVSPLPFYFLNM